jgi:MYXO-CTERM domain-containing protein
MSTGAKVGAGVGGAVGGLAVIGAGLFFFLRRRRQQKEAEETEAGTINAPKSVGGHSPTMSISQSTMAKEPYSAVSFNQPYPEADYKDKSQVAELPIEGSRRVEMNGQRSPGPHELGLHEMGDGAAAELPANRFSRDMR